MPSRPNWWHYNIAFSPHVIERMQDRGLSEIDIRTLLEDAISHTPSVVPGRFLIRSDRDNESWEIIVEPDESEKSLIVVTAYKLE